MYMFSTCPIDGDRQGVVYRHPSFTNYGLGVKIDRSGEMVTVECNIVMGNIDGVSKLETLVDHSVPLDVQLWCFTCMRVLRESVNTESLSLDALFPNNGGIVYYEINQESTS